jgi:Transcriptional regulator, AbiEi antitoxin, Type IV TA system
VSPADNRLARTLQRAIPGAHVWVESVLLDGTTLLKVDAGNGEIPLRARWIGSGWPKEAREALAQTEGGPSWPADLVLLARRFSPGALNEIGARSGNWADESGGARISAPGMFVSREGSDEIAPGSRFNWSMSATDIAELLLSRAWPGGFGTTEVANLSNWSTPQTSQVLGSFDKANWTVKSGPRRGRGAVRELRDPDGLLDAWASALVEMPLAVREASASIGDPLAFLRETLAPALDDRVRWALSGWAAAQQISPYLTTVPTLQIYVQHTDAVDALEGAISESGLRDVEEGGRVQFFSTPANLFSRTWTREELPLASPPRIYSDLQRLGPRGVEAAEHLKEEVIDPIHLGRRVTADRPFEELVSWERESRARLVSLVKQNSRKLSEEIYRHGTWSASYRLEGIASPPKLKDFRNLLQEVVGHETGWPAWMLTDGTEFPPRPFEDTIECWIADSIFEDPAYADFWRADPGGRLCLIRGYDEDGRDAPVKPGTSIDLTLPVWRVGECVLHAGRLGKRMGAKGIQLMMRWEGLEGRKLASYAERRRALGGNYTCTQSSVVTHIDTTSEEIDAGLVGPVSRLTQPLYSAFDFFEPPEGLYEEELAKLVSGPHAPSRRLA